MIDVTAIQDKKHTAQYMPLIQQIDTRQELHATSIQVRDQSIIYMPINAVTQLPDARPQIESGSIINRVHHVIINHHHHSLCVIS